MEQIIRVAHSPDSDDAFMFYPMVKGLIDTYGFKIEHILKDIESLNEDAKKGTYELSAISFHAYPYVADKYYVLPSGGSVGEGYGPIVVTKEPTNTIKGKRIGIPGELTTAYLVLRLFEEDFEPVAMPFDKILDEVEKGSVDAGLVIHEGQLTYKDKGLYKFVDLGEDWKQKYSLPLPLGCNIVRKDLGLDVIKKLENIMRESVKKALEIRKDALNYAINYARDLENDEARASKFVSMYVNERTIDYGPDGKEAVRLLYKLGKEKGIIKAEIPDVIFTDEL
ncbi:MAG: MqnA/MqnD/SBP family protein [Hydrogenobaculum sp.]